MEQVWLCLCKVFQKSGCRLTDYCDRSFLSVKNDVKFFTCLQLRKSIEKTMGRDLKEYKEFIDAQMLEILGQMDAPSMILDYLYLGSEWNASNLEELQNNG